VAQAAYEKSFPECTNEAKREALIAGMATSFNDGMIPRDMKRSGCVLSETKSAAKEHLLKNWTNTMPPKAMIDRTCHDYT
jgi:hypothetical protein